MGWREHMRNLWIERMVWVRHYIISLMMVLRDLSFVAARAFRNGTEIGDLFTRFYGVGIGNQVENLHTQHVLYLSEMASTLRSGGNLDPLVPNWNAISNTYVELIVYINPYLDRSAFQTAIQTQDRIEMDLLLDLSKNEYAEGIANFDEAHSNARQIAQILIEGIQKQFGL